MRFALMFLLAAVHPMLLLHDYVHGSEPDNQGFEFVSLNCGLRDPPYRDEVTNISYVSDDAYITTGEKHDVSSGYSSLYKSDLTLRSFPSGDWNCYTIPSPARGRKYLVRARFLHGNYDGRGNTRVMFDLYIGLDYWFTVYITNAAEKYTAEAITVTVASSLSVCLRNTGHGTPFISSLELRPMHSEMYPVVKVNRSLGVATRINMGASNLLRSCLAIAESQRRIMEC
uniref:Malectin-like domain-containing protein n=1 Tax=Leersia perrieri TaxID=77586 RepID=A0A0D9XCT6_9ORYZ